MHHMQKRQVERMYRERGVDVAEIDYSKLEKSENLAHLEELSGQPLDDISKRNPGVPPEQKLPKGVPDSVLDYCDEYLELYHSIRKLLDMEHLNLVRTKHEMGRAIFSLKQKLKERGEDVDEHGHSGALGELMKYLASDLKYSVSSLDHALHFYEKYPDWNAFTQSGIEVKQRGVSNSVRISGKEANWSQVLSDLYPGKGPKSLRADSLCDYDRYGRYDCVGSVKPLKKVYHLCPSHIKQWERKLTRLEFSVGMLDEYEMDQGLFDDDSATPVGAE